ncbi:phytoene/squalene synthase family protein [Alkalicoccus halolimnae]|uniref:Phytoene/squalene synthase family protein n=1 Tax=Alkalicoccus halolimnae TaxID=1667239 RepID=A0A5C7FDE1_9BACI|nr:phytoene/squalene synthase family protein [Alkalicoccus halolimnae]TXF83072.1 phytoene/squalene synthase family protein [Alkalicoccus halolimnae]
MQVQEAYDHCRLIIEQHSLTFAKAFKHLPRKKRQAVWAVYAFCRTADDIVDEGVEKERELKRFKKDLDRFADGDTPLHDPLWTALEDAFRHFSFDIQPFYDMIKGQEMDLYGYNYRSFNEVLNYSYHVASTVGLMLLPILAPDAKEELKLSAVKLGYAMQITNILRDIGEDMDRDRKYIPDELMKKYGYTQAMLERREVNQGFISIWEEMAQSAEKYYEEGLELTNLYPVHSRLPVQAAALLYKRILHSARRNEYDVFKRRAVVSQEEKSVILNELASIK